MVSKSHSVWLCFATNTSTWWVNSSGAMKKRTNNTSRWILKIDKDFRKSKKSRKSFKKNQRYLRSIRKIHPILFRQRGDHKITKSHFFVQDVKRYQRSKVKMVHYQGDPMIMMTISLRTYHREKKISTLRTELTNLHPWRGLYWTRSER